MDPIQNKSTSSSKRDRNIEYIGPDSDTFPGLGIGSGKESSVDFNGHGNGGKTNPTIDNPTSTISTSTRSKNSTPTSYCNSGDQVGHDQETSIITIPEEITLSIDADLSMDNDSGERGSRQVDEIDTARGNTRQTKRRKRRRGRKMTKNTSGKKATVCGSVRQRWHYTLRLLTRFSWMILYISIISFTIHRARRIVSGSLNKHEIAWTIGGTFVVATVPISSYQIYQHLAHFVSPLQQTHVIRMISMVPIYAIQSWFSLRYPVLSLYTLNIREAYEAYVVYSFVNFLINYMQSNDPHYIKKLASKPAYLGKHMYPFCCCKDWRMGGEFLTKCKLGVLQYLGVRLCTLILTLFLEHFRLYEEGSYSIQRGFFWLTLINCCSQTWALYVLILFYHATHKELVAINPCVKFLSIKAVVFASWWQSLLIGVMVHRGTIGELDSHSAEMVAKGVQDLLICTEMLMASVAFTFAFPLSDFVTITYADGVYSYSEKGEEHAIETRHKSTSISKQKTLSPFGGHHSMHHQSLSNDKKGSVIYNRTKTNLNAFATKDSRPIDNWQSEISQENLGDCDSISFSLSTLDDSSKYDIDGTIDSASNTALQEEGSNISSSGEYEIHDFQLKPGDSEKEDRDEYDSDDPESSSYRSKFNKINKKRQNKRQNIFREPEYDSFWHALWISCIPSDVREEFRLATLEYFRNIYNHYAYNTVANEANIDNDDILLDEMDESENEDPAGREDIDNEQMLSGNEKETDGIHSDESQGITRSLKNVWQLWTHVASQWSLFRRRANQRIRKKSGTKDVKIRKPTNQNNLQPYIEVKSTPQKYVSNSFKRSVSVDGTQQQTTYTSPSETKQSAPRSAMKKTKSEIDFEN